MKNEANRYKYHSATNNGLEKLSTMLVKKN